MTRPREELTADGAPVRWVDKAWGELSTSELYAFLTLRQRVFSVEQRCAYLDCDGRDPDARHLWTHEGAMHEGGGVLAYARYFAPGVLAQQAVLGRVVTAPEARRLGLGRALVREGLSRIEATYGRVGVEIHAQAYLEAFYASFGFGQVGDPFLEDGIWHLLMIRPA